MRNPIALLLCCFTMALPAANDQSDTAPVPGSTPQHDIVVYGDSSGALVAAIAAKREGRSVIWVNPTSFAGGMGSSGLGATGFPGYRSTFGGIVSGFYDGVAIAWSASDGS